jgi:4-amino-4-deoxy-L-arabinose transferase-like glycosyltransferase
LELRGVGDAGLAREVKAARLALAALAALTLVRLAMAAALPLAPDEAYYWVWSRALAAGYPDHPPMVALWIRAGTALAGDGALGVRLLGPLSAALGSVLLWDAGEKLLGRGTGLLAASLLNATLLLGVGAVIMTPDTPLLLFWTGAFWGAARWLRHRHDAWWLLIGASAGLALDSKYSAALLWLGLLLWLGATREVRATLKRPAPWLGALVGAAMFAPVLIWNAEHGWVSFARQGGRIEAWSPARAVQFLGELIGGQIGLATPLVFLLCVAGVVVAVQRAWRSRDQVWTLLAALTVLPALVFIEHAAGDRVQGNWPAIIYPAAVVAAAGVGWPRWRLPAVVLGLIITFVVYVQVALAPVALPPRLDPSAQRLAGWGELAAAVEQVRRAQGADFVVADQYGVAAELARAPGDAPMVGVGARWALLNLPHAPLAAAPGLLVRDARAGDPVDWREWHEVGAADRTRDGMTIQQFRLFRVAGGTEPQASLPRP